VIHDFLIDCPTCVCPVGFDGSNITLIQQIDPDTGDGECFWLVVITDSGSGMRAVFSLGAGFDGVTLSLTLDCPGEPTLHASWLCRAADFSCFAENTLKLNSGTAGVPGILRQSW
jgi:hypothetical protein